MKKLKIHNPFDAHVHLRQGDLLKAVAPSTAEQFAGALVMPNLTPPLTSPIQIEKYKQEILDLSKDFVPHFAFFLSPNLTQEDIKNLAPYVLSAKLYPDGITTNSDGGTKDLASKELYAQLEVLQDLGIALCIHGETNGFVLDREAQFAPIYEHLARDFPRLKIIAEHISTKIMAELIGKYDNLYATITLHHLLLDLDDLLGGGLNPHYFCKPVVKTPADKQALLDLVFSKSKKIMFGSDSAPHLRSNKETSNASAGVFTAPVLLPLLAELFDTHNKLDLLQDFVSSNAQKIYGLNLPQKMVELEKRPFTPKEEIGGVRVFGANRQISWSLAY